MFIFHAVGRVLYNKRLPLTGFKLRPDHEREKLESLPRPTDQNAKDARQKMGQWLNGLGDGGGLTWRKRTREEQLEADWRV